MCHPIYAERFVVTTYATYIFEYNYELEAQFNKVKFYPEALRFASFNLS